MYHEPNWSTELGNLSYLDSTDSGGSLQAAGQFIVKILVF
jgi:hypothetical protein